VNAKTRKALMGSIKKWEKIVAGTGEDDGTDNCPLCAVFININASRGCDGCPVYVATRGDVCDGSPYIAWLRHVADVHDQGWPCRSEPGCPECKRLAQSELDFLRSLLPEDGDI